MAQTGGMETSYQEFGGNNSKDQTTKKVLVGLLILTCIALIAVSIVAGVVSHSSSDDSNDSDSSTNAEYCTSTDCLELAADISATLNTSVDPCDDFYHYVCDGWDNEMSWTEINVPSYGQFQGVMDGLKEAFLDAMFYKTKSSLVDHSSVEKAQIYFQTCQDGSVDLEELEESPFWALLVNHTSFADTSSNSTSWTDEEKGAFHDTLVYLTQMGYNSLFQLQAAAPKEPAFIQFIQLWQLYDQLNGTMGTYLISSIFTPWYMTYFGLNANDSASLAAEVTSFADKINKISTVSNSDYLSQDTLMAMITDGDFSDLATSYGDTEYVNYTKLVLDVYGIKSTDDLPTKYQYLTGGVSYFQSLSAVIEGTKPSTVQAYILSSILYYYMDFKDTYSQQNYETRTDFCYDRTKDAFPFVYGYILYNEAYNDETYELAVTITNLIKDSGVKTDIEESTWLDDDSKAAALKKINNMDLYIGFPDRIGDGDNVDTYYKQAVQSADAHWMSNLEEMAQWQYITDNASFWGHGYNLTAGWPGIFEDPTSFGSWLTGINAFYYPVENFFTIPVTISQPPFLDGSEGYPSSVQYGGLGVVCGHEMSHGFDPSGSAFSWNGSYVGSIYTEDSQVAYQERMDCLIDQYDNILVETLSDGTKVYVDGNTTITENVADNAGVVASWAAWQKYIDENGDDKKLYGVDLTQEQLFFVGYARLWCETARPGAYANWTDVHAPNYARVVGALQNSEDFADAFSCKSGTFMNPENKCSVW